MRSTVDVSEPRVVLTSEGVVTDAAGSCKCGECGVDVMGVNGVCICS